MHEVEIIYALPMEQKSFYLLFENTITAKEVIEQSRILEIYPELKIEELKLGVYSKQISLDTEIKNNDRLEIYRDLTIDPKQARMIRAEQKRSKIGNNWRIN